MSRKSSRPQAKRRQDRHMWHFSTRSLHGSPRAVSPKKPKIKAEPPPSYLPDAEPTKIFTNTEYIDNIFYCTPHDDVLQIEENDIYNALSNALFQPL